MSNLSYLDGSTLDAQDKNCDANYTSNDRNCDAVYTRMGRFRATRTTRSILSYPQASNLRVLRSSMSGCGKKMSDAGRKGGSTSLACERNLMPSD